MRLTDKHVVIVGAGITGLTAATGLASQGAAVTVLEKSPFPGGHAIQLSCKAAPDCVKCGACVAEETLLHAHGHAGIALHTGVRIDSVAFDAGVNVQFSRSSPVVNANRCNGCGLCFEKCPVPGAILQGNATRSGPYVAIREDLCRFFDSRACTLCRDICPQHAIKLVEAPQSDSVEADALLLATGFAPYNPSAKPYGYGRFENVITSLDAERRLRRDGALYRSTDGLPAKRVALIQCVGSRDATLGHQWCSKICCGSSLRMARLIQSRCADTRMTCFYIDVQSFGKDFNIQYPLLKKEIEMIRAIPGDVMQNSDGELMVAYFDPVKRQSVEANFDVIILSVGLTPSPDNAQLSKLLQWPLAESGFLMPHDRCREDLPSRIFTAGAALGPKSIFESITSAQQAVWDMVEAIGPRVSVR